MRIKIKLKAHKTATHQLTGGNQPSFWKSHTLVKNQYKSPIKYDKTVKNIILYTRILIDNCQHQPGNDENSSGSQRVLFRWTFWKTELNLNFLERRETHATVPISNNPVKLNKAIRIKKKNGKLVWAPHLWRVQSVAVKKRCNVVEVEPGRRPSKKGQTPGHNTGIE
jgi:hypothetical protein